MPLGRAASGVRDGECLASVLARDLA
jgi:hypothetical protein